jgi:hypothetical protein
LAIVGRIASRRAGNGQFVTSGEKMSLRFLTKRDLTMALFAKFWVNGHQDELVSLLG